MNFLATALGIGGAVGEGETGGCTNILKVLSLVYT